MSIVFDTLQNSIYAWANANSPIDVPVIWYYPNAPMPETTYISLNITTFNKMAWDYIPRPLDDPGNVTLKGDREITLNVQCYGINPMQILENLRTSVQTEIVKNLLNADGLAYFGTESIIDLTSLVDSRYESRASVDMYFRIGQQYSDILGTIATVEVTEEFFNAAEVLIFEETYTVPAP